MAWRLWFVVVVLSACQACKGEVLVNLVRPRTDKYGGIGELAHCARWTMFDGDKTTYIPTSCGRYSDVNEVFWSTDRLHPIRPTRYRITLAAHVEPKDYPRDWKLKATATSIVPRSDGIGYDLDSVKQKPISVKGADFENGVYEGSLGNLENMASFSLYFQAYGFDLAQIELLGPRAELDAMWPYGNYPCSQHLAIITPAGGPKNVFQRSKHNISRRAVRPVFNPGKKFYLQLKLHFDGSKPVIMGARSEELVNVKEVVVRARRHGLTLQFWKGTTPSKAGRFGVARVVLQGNVCTDNRCTRYGTKGWVKLATARPPFKGVGWPDGLSLPIENPGSYKGLRLKFYPRIEGGKPSKRFHVNGIFFYGCTA